MITPSEIRKRAEKKYRHVLKAWLMQEDCFPLSFPVGNISADIAQRRREITQLHEGSKAVLDSGYELQFVTVKRRTLGIQTEPKRVTIGTLTDYLTVVQKKGEFEQFSADVELIRKRLPQLEQWLHVQPQAVITYSNQWHSLLLVCENFLLNPQPNVYARELPIPIHTKFIETHEKILQKLLDYLLPDNAFWQNEANFTRRFGLLAKPALVRIRLLDNQLQSMYGIGIDDFNAPVEQIAHLLSFHIKPQRVFVVENQINFLTLPHFSNAVGILGNGFAVHLLRDVAWLNNCEIVYWGDVDAHGFQILSDLRGLFSHVRSAMMDRQTVADNRRYVGVGKPLSAKHFDHLTVDELSFANEIIEQNSRLEQEHIPHAYVCCALEQFA